MLKLITFITIIFSSILANAQNEVTLSFLPSWGNSALHKDSIYVSAKGDSIKFETLKFFISNIKLKAQKGKGYTEKDSYHLLDCEEENTMKFALKGVPEKEFVELSFDLGVDSAKSVTGAHEGALDPTSGMYWAWQSGYINFKIEGTSPSCPTRKNQFQFHIGGYQFPYNALRRVTIKLPKIDRNILGIQFDLKVLFDEIDLKSFNSVMIPGKEAMGVADMLGKVFGL
jgi:hypothetical protein